jgi:hypothetical protein
VERENCYLTASLSSSYRQVSDFGLTRFRDEAGQGKSGGDGMGSVYWMAPEVLNAEPDFDYAPADVRSLLLLGHWHWS